MSLTPIWHLCYVDFNGGGGEELEDFSSCTESSRFLFLATGAKAYKRVTLRNLPRAAPQSRVLVFSAWKNNEIVKHTVEVAFRYECSSTVEDIKKNNFRSVPSDIRAGRRIIIAVSPSPLVVFNSPAVSS